MTALDPAADHPLITDDLIQALLTDRPQRQMIVQELTQQLPPVTADALLQPGMIKTSSVGPIQKTGSCAVSGGPVNGPQRPDSSVVAGHASGHRHPDDVSCIDAFP